MDPEVQQVLVEGSRPPSAARPETASMGRLLLDRTADTFVDSFLPRHGGPFVAAALAIGVACWGAGFLLAADKHKFLMSREWQCEPVYLAAHFITLRLFVTAYSRHFLAGCARLTVPPGEAERQERRAFAPAGWVLAILLAAPLAYFDDFVYLTSAEYVEKGSGQGPGGTLGWTDGLIGVVWTVEWIINAYVWVVILGFLVRTMHVLNAWKFRDPVEVVLGERQYRPFLAMSAQGATVLIMFSGFNAAYAWYAGAEWTDYLGLWITTGLLIFCFMPPWLRLKNGIVRMARVEAEHLNREVQQGWTGIESGSGPEATTSEGLASRVHLLLTMARAGHLERLNRDFGKNESGATVLRLLAPLSTLVWRLVRPLLPM